MKIALIDSGVGGLNVLFGMVHHCPHNDYLYIADNLCAPYGSHSNNNLAKRIDCLVRAIVNKVDLIVLACNTASLAMLAYIDSYAVPIIPIYPHDVVTRDSIVLATPLSSQLLSSILPSGVDIIACPRLASDIEQSIASDLNKDLSLAQLLAPYKHIKHCYLACTHYLFYKPVLKRILPKAKFYDGIQEVISAVLAKNTPKSYPNGSISIFFTGTAEVEKYNKIIKNCFNNKLPVAFISVL